MDSHDAKENLAAASHSEAATANKENVTKKSLTPPRKAPAARDKLKPLAMPKTLKI